MQAGMRQFLKRTPKRLQGLAVKLGQMADAPYNRRPLSAAEKAAGRLEEDASEAGLQSFSQVAGAIRHTLQSCNEGLAELNPRHLEVLQRALSWLQECLTALQESQAEKALPKEDWLELLQKPQTLSADEPAPSRAESQQDGIGMSLDDLAALLVQLDPEDLSGLEEIQKGLQELAAGQQDNSQAAELLGTAAKKLGRASQAGSSKKRGNLLSEAGLYIDAASDMMEAAPGSAPVDVDSAEAVGSQEETVGSSQLAVRSSEKKPGTRNPEHGEGFRLQASGSRSENPESGSETRNPEPGTSASASAPDPASAPEMGIEELLQLLSAKGAAEALDLATVLESLQALSQDSIFSSDVRELLSQAAARCSSFDEHEGNKETLIAEIGLCLDAVSDMLECSLPQDQAPGAAESWQAGQETLPEPHEEDAAPAKPLMLQLPEDTDSELMGEFITESNEAIDAAEASLLDLETSPEDVEAIDTVFRSFHTIKGTSAFLGLDILTHLGHLSENLLSRIREKEIVCRGGYADLALRSVDILKELLQGVQDALGGQDFPVPESYHSLVALLEDPEAHGISDESSYAEPPPARLGDILVSQGKADRQEVEAVAASKGDAPLGEALVKSSTAKVSDVAQALRSQKASPEASLRVRTEKLDQLIDMVGELVIAHSMVAQDELMLDRTHYETARKVTHAGKIVTELQDLCMSLRMVPMRAVFQKMARLVRDLSRKVGKQVEFSTEGEETEIDRNMVDIIGDPLVHMVRNAVDHGIEMPQDRQALGKPPTGQVRLHAYHAGGNVIVELTDDGRGLNREQIAAKAVSNGLIESADGLSDREVFELIFAAGFSTAEEVTDVSGRGVGMDVVRRGIESLRGRVQISSNFGQGSTFTIVLPLTLAITDGLLVSAGAERFIIPTVNIYMNFRPKPDSLSTVAGRGEMVLLRNELMPIYRLHRLFNIEDAVQEPTQGILVVVGDGNRRCAVMVDELLGQQQVVAKSLGDTLGRIRGVSGAAILGDGKVGLILDTTGLVEIAQQCVGTPMHTARSANFSNGVSA